MHNNDDNGYTELHIASPPKRVISLVPSLTESLFDLGFGSSVIAVTDYCIHPREKLSGLPRIGGPKNPRIQDILDLKPDLVLANVEENSRPDIEALQQARVGVWLTFPKTVREALDILWILVGIYQSTTAAIRLETLELTLDWVITSAKENIPLRYFCPIWTGETQGEKLWWMTFNRDTYCDNLLEIIGGENIFADRQRSYPLSADLGLAKPKPNSNRDTRYPRVTLAEILSLAPEVMLLPSEPWEFSESDKENILRLLADTPAVSNGRVHLVDGSLISWHGTRLAHALRELPSLFSTD